MRPVFLAAVLAVAFAGGAWADTWDFPSADSTVVGSVGFIDDDEIGYFWSASRGDSVTEAFADPASEVSQAIFDFSVPTNSLRSVASQWGVLINGTTIGNFSVPVGFTGDMHLDLSFDPIPTAGGEYSVRFAHLNEIPGGAGSHTLAYAGDWMHSVSLIPEPATLGLLAVGAIGLLRRRR